MPYISPSYNTVSEPEIIVKTFTRQVIPDEVFGSPNPVWLEIGFGVGKFFLNLAERFPDINILGIEHNPYRYFKMCEKILRLNIHNVRIINIDAPMAVRYLLPAGSLSGVFINFPDPWPKSKHEKNRLFSSFFIRDLARCMGPGAVVRIQTDVDWYAEHIAEYMLLENLFYCVERFEPDIKFPTTTFQDRFIRQGIPYYTQLFKKRLD
ncbi:MAG: tRNA (guanosine(46)-N7)-methyltransferase TrmB [Candidatus Auribacterota bacterium]|jgi:tRNA (guanine-N7-)-methyltransferase|nr:tRNA (guanosine(46)-N7)-methyltransferase TrmB [Candidatus Auribacterota bacterium]